MEGVPAECVHAPGTSIGGAEMAGIMTDDVVHRLAQGRDEVGGAILLVADGTYQVVIANLPDARMLAHEFRTEAARRGVELVLEQRGSGREDLRVRRL
jgi:hypothetical protein